MPEGRAGPLERPGHTPSPEMGTGPQTGGHRERTARNDTTITDAGAAALVAGFAGCGAVDRPELRATTRIAQGIGHTMG